MFRTDLPGLFAGRPFSVIILITRRKIDYAGLAGGPVSACCDPTAICYESIARGDGAALEFCQSCARWKSFGSSPEGAFQNLHDIGTIS